MSCCSCCSSQKAQSWAHIQSEATKSADLLLLPVNHHTHTHTYCVVSKVARWVLGCLNRWFPFTCSHFISFLPLGIHIIRKDDHIVPIVLNSFPWSATDLTTRLMFNLIRTKKIFEKMLKCRANEIITKAHASGYVLASFGYENKKGFKKLRL